VKPLGSANIVYLIITVAAGALCYLLAGADAWRATTASSARLLAGIAPILVGAMLVGGYFQALVPRETVGRLLGGESGLRGLLLASAAGAVTPGGPFASFPLAAALYRSGADIGTTVAFLTSWSVLSLLRLAVWEIPLIGVELSLVRLLASLPLPLLAGIAARLIARRFAVAAADREAP
jgi:uncharacterized membrane protein YraQ (UPF0718 family)